MTILWETYCRTVALTKILPRKIKAWVLAQRILESGRGTTRQATELLNFGAMMRKPELDLLAHGWEMIDRYDYARFWSIEEEIRYFWALVHRKAYYPDVDKHTESGEDFIDYIGRHGYCPPGYPGSPAHEKWVQATGFQTYTDYIRSLVPEAKFQLAKYGLIVEEDPMPIPQPIPAPVPIPVPAPVPGSLFITDGILTGPNVKYWWVKNHDNFNRSSTIGIVFHEPDAHSSGQEATGMGILYDWSIKTTYKSAHALILEDGTIIQTVDFMKPAWQCIGENMRRLGFEVANIGPFWPYQEVFGWFFRFRNKPWEQKIRKSDMQLINGMYWDPYTDAQIASSKALVAACEMFFGHSLSVDGHNKFDNQRVDPGPLFWEKFNR